jgi:phage terminase small subunit
MAADLTPKQRSFVEQYLISGNATEAAINAGYSAKSAASQASQLMSNPKVAVAVQQALEARAERTGITADMVLAELARIAFSDLRDVATWGEDTLALIDSSELTEDAARSLREVVATTSQTEHGTTNRLHVKQHDKMKALELLGKHLGMFREKLDVHHTGGLTLTALARMVEPEGETGAGELES